MANDRAIERLLSMFLVAVTVFCVGAYVGRCRQQYDPVTPCVPAVATDFEPLAGGWVDEYGHLVMRLEYEDALPFCEGDR